MASRARLLIVAWIAAAGCHAKPGVWFPDEHVLCQGRVCYRVGELPPEWRIVHKEGAEIGFFNDAVGGVIQANATCRDDADVAPLDALTKHLLIGYTERKILDENRITLDHREALRTRVSAKLDGVPVLLDLYVLKRNGCVFDLSYAAPPERYPDGASDFARFVGGFVDARKS